MSSATRSATKVSDENSARKKPACLVSSTRRSRRSEKARLPTKLSRSISETRPSATSKTRSTRLSLRRMILGCTVAAIRPELP